MARGRGRPKKYDEPIINPNKERLRQLAASIERIDGEIAELRKDKSEYLKSAKEAQIKTDVLTSCVKLAKMEGGARQLWLDCFDQYRIDLGLDNMASELQPQTDLEDAIAKAPASDAAAKPEAPKPAPEQAAAEKAATAKANGAARKTAANGKAGVSKGDAQGALGTAPKPPAGVLGTAGDVA